MALKYELKQEGVAAWAAKAAAKVCNSFFSSRMHINGQQIVELTKEKQVNMLVLRHLFEQWQGETAKLKSPYFDFSNGVVQAALKTFMDQLSQHILVDRAHFEPILVRALAETLELGVQPDTYIYGILKKLGQPEVPLDKLKLTGRYILVNKFLVDALVQEMEITRSNTMFSGQLNRHLMKAHVEKPHLLEPVPAFVERLGAICPIHFNEVVTVLGQEEEESQATSTGVNFFAMATGLADEKAEALPAEEDSEEEVTQSFFELENEAEALSDEAESEDINESEAVEEDVIEEEVLNEEQVEFTYEAEEETEEEVNFFANAEEEETEEEPQSLEAAEESVVEEDQTGTEPDTVQPEMTVSEKTETTVTQQKQGYTVVYNKTEEHTTSGTERGVLNRLFGKKRAEESEKVALPVKGRIDISHSIIPDEKRTLADIYKDRQEKEGQSLVEKVSVSQTHTVSMQSTVMHASALKSLKSLVGLHDRISFIKELFGGNTQAFEDAIAELNEVHTRTDAINLVLNKYALDNNWNFDRKAANTFMEIVEKRFGREEE